MGWVNDAAVEIDRLVVAVYQRVSQAYGPGFAHDEAITDASIALRKQIEADTDVRGLRALPIS